MQHWNPRLGAVHKGNNRYEFCVWAPNVKTMELHLVGGEERSMPMERGEQGYYTTTLKMTAQDQRYFYRMDGIDYPDPASRYQPEGVYGPSQVTQSSFAWSDANWIGVPIQDYIIYEMHIGTFTEGGTFESAIDQLDALVELGVTAVELLPICQFSGDWNWGYDGVFLFAVQNNYGGPDGLRKFVDACHLRGIAVILDVVFNHFGPEGNCVCDFGPYTTDRYKTPWGEAINVDGEYADEVRAYFIENALYWLYEFHIDALRLDATHYIFDFSAVTFMEELIATVHQHRELLNRKIYLIAEEDRNDANLLRSPEVGGWDMDAQWLDDFHHALYTNIIPGEGYEYHNGFGEFKQVVKAFREGFVFSGQYSPFRKRRHGTPSGDIPGEQFIVFTQNHDQIGNRIPGDRLDKFTSFDGLKLFAGVVLLAPYVPMIFMGEEYCESAPFNYFTNFSGKELIELVRTGRKETFGGMIPEGQEVQDPQAETTFTDSKLDHTLRTQGKHRVMLDFYKALISLRKTLPALNDLSKERMEVEGYEEQRVLYLRRWNGSSHVAAAFNFADSITSITLPFPVGRWCKELDSGDARWREAADHDSTYPEGNQQTESMGEVSLTLQPLSFAVFVQED
jgi:maltooligosyltrehalose trehalohydrolase